MYVSKEAICKITFIDKCDVNSKSNLLLLWVGVQVVDMQNR